MAASSRSDQVTLARRLLEQTGGDRDQAQRAMTGLGYTKTDATRLLDQVAPKQPAATPTPAAGTREGRPAPAAAGTAKPAGSARASGTTTTARSTGGRRTSSSSSSSSGWSWPKGRPTLRPPRRLSLHDAGWFGAGLFGFALVLNYIRYGPGGLTGWLSAKFVNKPYQPATEPGYGDGGQTTRPGLGDFGATPPAAHPNRLRHPRPARPTPAPSAPPGGVIFQ